MFLYKVIKCKNTEDKLEELFNSMSADGWEPHTFTYAGGFSYISNIYVVFRKNK